MAISPGDNKGSLAISGSSISNDEISGELKENGEIQWSTGITSRLWHPCKAFSTCSLNLKAVSGQKGHTWHSFDATRNNIETFRIESRE